VDRLDESRVWRCGLTFITAPHQHLRTAQPGIRSGFLGETRLADPRLARDHHQRCLSAESAVDCGAQHGHLLGPADEPTPSQASSGGLPLVVFELTHCGRSVELSRKSRFSMPCRLLASVPDRFDR